MKGFDRDYPWLSLCGLNCRLCTLYMDQYCPGCGGGEGNQSCAIARCSLSHGGVTFCSQCGEFPCARYEQAEEDETDREKAVYAVKLFQERAAERGLELKLRRKPGKKK